ncbi:hypothetical protein Pelo_16901 [Pelomyxa schiedti]|nr:hypothetical protein Pelo_16901 [Pelomyxa schiedti]
MGQALGSNDERQTAAPPKSPTTTAPPTLMPAPDTHNGSDAPPTATTTTVAATNGDGNGSSSSSTGLLVMDGDGTLQVMGSPNLDASIENIKPAVIAFLGETQVGKSFLTDRILTFLHYNEALPRPIIGTESVSVTKGVHYYIAGDTFFLDLEGSYADLTPNEEEIVNRIYPRIAYSVSSTIVYITKSAPASGRPLQNLLEPLRNAALIESNEAYNKPDLVIVYTCSHCPNFDGRRWRDDPNYKELQSMFSHVHGFCLCNEFENRNTFQEQLPTLVDSLRHLRLPLESHKWIYLFRAVVDHFNIQRSAPIPLCNIYASLLDNLEPPLHRVQQLFLSCIPNRVCTYQEFIQCCDWANRALPVVVAAHFHGSLQVTPDTDDAYYRKQFNILAAHLRRFTPCAACVERDGIVYKCSVQHRFHSNHRHEAHNGVRTGKKWKGEFVPVDFIEDNAESERQVPTTAKLREILANSDNHSHCTWDRGSNEWCEHQPLPSGAAEVLKQLTDIRKMNIWRTIKNAGRGVVVGTALGVACAAPIAIGVGVVTMGLGIPISVIILGVGGSLGGTVGGTVGAAKADRKPEDVQKALMENVCLLAYVKGWNVVTLVETLDHIIFVKIENI